MIHNYIKIALRNILKNKTHAFINVLGLAIGMAAFILLTCWVIDETSFENYHPDADRLCRVIWDIDAFKIPATPGPFADWLEENVPEVEIATRINHGYDKLEYEQVKTGAVTRYVEPELFQILGIEFLYGDPKTALNDVNAIVLTESKAKILFGDENPVGTTLYTNNGTRYPKTVSGVIKDIPRRTHPYLRQTESFMPLELMRHWRNPDSWDDAQDYKTYVLLKEGITAEQATATVNANFKAFVEKYDPDRAKLFKQSFTLQLFKDIHLHSNFKFDGNHGNFQYVIFLGIIAVFTLLIALFNYVNLTTALAIKRMREVGVRKSIGAGRAQLVGQFLLESFIVTSVALVLAIGFVELYLPVFNNLTGKPLFIDYSALPTLTSLLALLLAVTALSGFYPAVFLSNMQPIKSLKENFSGPGRGRSITLRKTLVVGQFAISIIIIIATLFVYQQLDFMQNKNMGFEKENLVYLQTEGFSDKYQNIKSELLQQPDVINVSATNSSPIEITNNNGATWEGKENDAGYISFPTLFVTPDFMETFQIEMAQGRFYSPEHPSDWQDAFVVNEAAVQAMKMQDPVGKYFSAWNKNGNIIGVVKDFHFRSLRTQVEPMLLHLDGGYNFLHVRIQSQNIQQTLQSIQNIYLKYYPDQEIQLHFLDDKVDELYQSEQRLANVFLYFALFAIFISCLGLLGLVLFISESKTKEIGIRKTLGSSFTHIIYLLIKDFISWILVANIIAWPLAWFAMHTWLQNFAYRIDITPVPFLVAGCAALFIGCLTTSLQAAKAARANPVEALRYE